MRQWRVPYPKFGDGPGLERVRAVAAHLSVDLARFGQAGAVVVGSNGKGSTAAMCAALLEQKARPVGLFTSPHLLALNERFRLDGEDISDAELEQHWRRAEAAIDAEGLSKTIGGFEFLFLIAADWFAARGAAHTVWEAGIGGRFDPVRTIEARRVALTSLDLEHTALLGDTLDAIARDKIDAAPRGAIVFVAQTCMPQRAVIEEQASANGARVEFVGPETLGALSPPVRGAHQRENAALAVKLARDIAALDEASVAAGLAATRWPGRLEVLDQAPLTVIDVGHTPAGIEAGLAGFREIADARPAVLVCGVSQDKHISAIVSALAPRFAHIICAAALHKGAPAAQIAAHANAANPQAEIVLAESVTEAHALARAKARAIGGAIYAAGGLFLAAEFKAVHSGRDPAALVFF
jgi:dihydrofolate synthase/folylpolyglutamate synthase